MKKVFAILLALGAMSIVLSGCSGGGDAASPDAGKTDGGAAKTDEAAKTE